MANRIVKGNELMLFDSAKKSFAYATNHTLTLTAETSDTSSKDHGMWSSAEVTKLSWEIQSENIYTEVDFNSFFDKWVAGEKITLVFGLKDDLDTTHSIVPKNPSTIGDNWNCQDEAVTTEGKTQTGVYYTGEAIITSLTANANNGENATYSVTFQGVGNFSKKTPA